MGPATPAVCATMVLPTGATTQAEVTTTPICDLEAQRPVLALTHINLRKRSNGAASQKPAGLKFLREGHWPKVAGAEEDGPVRWFGGFLYRGDTCWAGASPGRIIGVLARLAGGATCIASSTGGGLITPSVRSKRSVRFSPRR
jgi:hypothetical protein